MRREKNSFGGIIIIFYLFKFIVLMQPFGYERPTPHLILTDNIHSDTQAEPRKLSSLTLYIDLWQEGKPAPGQNPPVISPPMVIFRRIGFRAEIRTQNPVLSNTRLAKMVPLSHLRRRITERGQNPARYLSLVLVVHNTYPIPINKRKKTIL
jgi:hypothetical protein